MGIKLETKKLVFRSAGLFLALILVVAPLPGAADENVTGLPIPRFVTLRQAETNLRTGPGVRYPIEWVYHVQNLPMELVAEFDTWRKLRDMEGDEGWVHSSVLAGRRHGLVKEGPVQVYREPSPDAPAVAVAQPKVLVRLLSCDTQWCKVDLSGFRGYMEKSELWGVYPEETFE